MTTAIITGASSGLGLAYARQLVKKNDKVVLCARNEERLAKAKEELLQLSPDAQIETMSVDLSTFDGIDALANRVASTPDLEWMINNAGFGLGGQIYPDNDIKRSTDMLVTHCGAVERLSYEAAKVMKANGRGYILNTSSVGAFFFGKGSVDYCSTKAFVVSFTRGLACDLKGTGVRAVVLCPGFVRTGFHSTPEMLVDKDLYGKIPNWLWMDADWVVKKAIRCAEHGSTVMLVPSVKYKIAVFFLRRLWL